jgi:hypothetical protein
MQKKGTEVQKKKGGGDLKCFEGNFVLCDIERDISLHTHGEGPKMFL